MLRIDIDSDLTMNIVLSTPNGLSILACLSIFVWSLSLSKRTLGIKMFTILSFSHLIFHTTGLLDYWLEEEPYKEIGRIIHSEAIRFSIFWTTNMTFFLYLVLEVKEVGKLDTYYKYSLVLLLFLSLCLTAEYELLKQEYEIAATLSMMIFLFLSMATTVFLYKKIICKLEEVYGQILDSMKATTKNVYRYSSLQFLTVAPIVIFEFVESVWDFDGIVYENIAKFTLGLTGLINASLFLLSQKSIPKTPSEANSPTSDQAAPFTQSVETSLLVGMNRWN